MSAVRPPRRPASPRRRRTRRCAGRRARPGRKLESGVRQIWSVRWNWLRVRTVAAGNNWRSTLASSSTNTEPNAWRLSGRLKDGRALRLDHAVKPEEPDAAWPELAALLAGARGSRQNAATLAAPFPAHAQLTRRNQRQDARRRGSRRRWSRACAPRRTHTGRASTIRGRRFV